MPRSARGDDPTQEVAHLSVLIRPQYQMPVIGHQLEGEQLDVISLQSCSQDTFKRVDVSVFTENLAARVPPIQGMIQSTGFIGEQRTWHAKIVTPTPDESRSPDPFVSAHNSRMDLEKSFHFQHVRCQMLSADKLQRLKLLRATAIEILLGNEKVPYPPIQFKSLSADVAAVLSRKDQTKLQPWVSITGGVEYLSEEDNELLRETVEEFKREGVLIDGLDSANPRWPFFRLTTRAVEILQNQKSMAQLSGSPIVQVYKNQEKPMLGTMNSADAPKVFISYSWDDESHKQWVREFATRLREDGVDATLDKWSVIPGDRLPLFMEQAIRENCYVIIICTEKYKEKSDNRKGGVGYEGDIMTAEIYAKGNHRKFIPVLRRGDWDTSMPSWLSGKYSIDLSTNPISEEQYQDLIATIHNIRDEAPPLGSAPKRVPAQTPLREAVKLFLPTKEPDNVDFAPVKIIGVLADEVGKPINDGTQGSALYAVPFKLSRSPTSEWSDAFRRTWDHPPQYTPRHRPNIARVQGDRIILMQTTIDEIKEIHRDTLKLVVESVNKEISGRVKQRQAIEQAKAEDERQHRENVRRIAGDISFDE